MTLSPDDARAFFSLWYCIDAFVSQRRAVAPGFETPAQMRGAAPATVVRIRDVLWSDPTLLDAFVAENPFDLPADDLETAAGFRHAVKGRFYVERILKAHAVFVAATGKQVYFVRGLSERIDDLLARARPVGYGSMVETVLLPFRGTIVWDGFPIVHNISFGPGLRDTFKDAYRTAKARGEIVQSLGGAPRAAPLPTKGPDWGPVVAGLARAADGLGKPDTALQTASFRLLKQCAQLTQHTLDEPADEAALEASIRASRRALKHLEETFARLGSR
ncbi:MAG: hypothetical protein Q8P41_26020 [Pseudomonadota bacterium]|nr:hypothetical protein [Pseudomonadota bacterium]